MAGSFQIIACAEQEITGHHQQINVAPLKRVQSIYLVVIICYALMIGKHFLKSLGIGRAGNEPHPCQGDLADIQIGQFGHGKQGVRV